MTWFLAIMCVMGVLEFTCSMYFLSKGQVPERTAGGMARNGLLQLGFAAWAYWLLVNAA